MSKWHEFNRRNQVSGQGESGDDAFKIGWPKADFKFNENSEVSSQNVSFYDRTNALNGVSFTYQDDLDYGDSDSGYGGCYVTKESGASGSTDFAVKYVHTYQSTETSGFSLTAGAIPSLSFTTSGQKNPSGHKQESHSEAEHQYTNC